VWQFLVPWRGNGQSYALILLQPREKLCCAMQKMCKVINEQYCTWTRIKNRLSKFIHINYYVQQLQIRTPSVGDIEQQLLAE